MSANGALGSDDDDASDATYVVLPNEIVAGNRLACVALGLSNAARDMPPAPFTPRRGSGLTRPALPTSGNERSSTSPALCTDMDRVRVGGRKMDDIARASFYCRTTTRGAMAGLRNKAGSTPGAH